MVEAYGNGKVNRTVVDVIGRYTHLLFKWIIEKLSTRGLILLPYRRLPLEQSKQTRLESDVRRSVEANKAKQDREKETLCPACGTAPLDQWSCKLVCHACGLRFTCDE